MKKVIPQDIKYMVGVDGGGTKTHVRLCDVKNHILAESVAGPSNIAQLGTEALESIFSAISNTFDNACIPLDEMAHTAVGIGLSGAENPDCKILIEAWQHPFASLDCDNDALIACLGAHLGEFGSILSIGTGIVGWENLNNGSVMRNGWGFPLADLGSGAWLGLRALQETLKADDGIILHSPLTQYLLDEFTTARNISTWAVSARSGQFAHYAKVVVDFYNHHHKKDAIAHQLIAEQVIEVEILLRSLLKRNPPRISLLGGMAHIIQPLIDPNLSNKLDAPLGDAITGAMHLIKAHPSSFCPFSHLLRESIT
jgi:glucosamine kinase